MKILENISNGYKRIATGIAIVLFLTVMYIALIPGASVAAQSFVMAASGTPIVGAFVKIVEWPQYNATTDSNGNYSINNMPIGTYNLSAWAPGYVRNTTPITVVTGNNVNNFALNPNANMTGIIWISSYDANGNVTATMASQLPRPYDIGTEFSGQYDSRWSSAGFFSVVLVSDVYGTGASLNITYLMDNGTFYSATTQDVPVNGTATIIPGSSGQELGKIKVKSNNPVVAEKRIASYSPAGTWNTVGIMSTLMPEKNSSDTQFFGQYDSRWSTAGYFSVILVSDVVGTGAHLNITYLMDNGSFYSQTTQDVPVNGTATIIPGSSGQELGKIKIKSDNPVVAEKRIASYSPVGTWNGMDLLADSMLKTSDASNELIVPIYDGRWDSLGWFSVVLLSDIYGTGANVVVDYLYMNGTKFITSNYQVPVNGTLTIIPGSIGLSQGKMLIHSDNLIVGEERIANFAPGTYNQRGILSFNLLKNTDATKNLVVPQYDSSGVWVAEVAVSAVNGASTPELNYFNGTGAFSNKEYYDILTNGTYAFYPGNITLGRPQVGRVTIKG